MRSYPSSVTILLPLSPRCWDYRNEPQFLASNYFFKNSEYIIGKKQDKHKKKRHLQA